MTVDGDASFNGNLDVSGRLTVDGDVSLNANVDISAHLTVEGDASFNSAVDISGPLKIKDLIVDGDVSFNKNVDISENLRVKGTYFSDIKTTVDNFISSTNFTIAAGEGPYAMAYSLDGLNFNVIEDSSGIFNSCSDIAWSSTLNRWVAVGEGTYSIAYSENGKTSRGVTASAWAT